jgi:hypothetical protein
MMLDQRFFVALVLLDFSKAFDTGDQALLCLKLEQIYGFSGSAVSFIESYLCGRFQCVCDGRVLQGFILGPLLFSLFNNDFYGSIRTFNYHMYADGVQLYSGDRYENMSQCIERLNGDLVAVQRWSMVNGLLLKTAKTQAMVICRDHGWLPSPVLKLRLSGCIIPYSSSLKNLGLIIDNRLSWHAQASSVRRKVGFVLSRLWYFADVTPLTTRMRLVQSLVVPLLMYCDMIYSQYTAEVTRYVYDIPRYCRRRN